MIFDNKRCARCGAVKPLPDFPRRATRSADGYRSTCRSCTNAIPARSATSRQKERAAMASRRGQSYRTKEEYAADVRAAAERHRLARHEQRVARARERAALAAQRAAEVAERSRAWERERRKTAKGRARRSLQDAVRRGTVCKPDHCMGCGHATEPTSLHGHHDDYSTPLDVRWLCPQCHVRAHGGNFSSTRNLPAT